MKVKRKISKCLMVVMLLSVIWSNQPMTYGATIPPFSVIQISSGFNGAVSVIKGKDGYLYVSEYSGNNILKMKPDGQDKTVLKAGLSQPMGMTFDSEGNLWVAQHSGREVGKISANGDYTSMKNLLGHLLVDVEIDSQGKIYILDYTGGKIYKMDSDGNNVTDFAVGLSVTALTGMTIDGNDNLYVSDRTKSKIVKITPAGDISTFYANANSPNGVTLGQDGYFYISTGLRTILKIDQQGNLVETINAGIRSAWGVNVEKDGYIYLTYLSSEINKIVGSALTNDTKHITLTMNQTIEGSVADPSAFTVTGIASNPQVTCAVTSGSSIELTLSHPITTADNKVKVNYTKTGSNNMIVAGSTAEFGDFKGLTVVNNIPRVIAVQNTPQITVANGTQLNAIPLTDNIVVNLSNGTTTSSAITWDSGTPTYNGDIAGTYTFSGTLGLSDSISNPSNLKATVNVLVQALTERPIVTGVSTINTITVDNGTPLSAVSLPNSVGVNLSNATTTSSAITWDNGTPAYNMNVAGTYVFKGSLILDDSLKNPNNIAAAVNVIIKAASNTNNGSNSSNGSSSQSSSSPSNTQPSNTIVKVNGESKKIGTEAKATINGVSKVEVSVDSGVMSNFIDSTIKASKDENKPIKNLVEISVVEKEASIAVVGLTGEIVKKLDDNDFDVLVKRNEVYYKIPAKQFTIDSVAQRLAVSPENLKDIKIEIQIRQVQSEKNKLYGEIIKANNGKMVVEPTEFDIMAKVIRNDGKVEDIAVNQFTQYAERIFELPKGMNPEEITTGIVFSEDNTYSHVPTTILMEDGKLFAKINSLTNSTYSVVLNPVVVESAKGHWGEKAINDMASRLVVNDTKQFVPDKDITRGELADYLVRGLGLYRADTALNSKFKDVPSDNNANISISIANEWGIINGYSDGTFKPNALVTREEAMVMCAKAMAITKFDSIPPSESSEKLMTMELPKWSKSYVEKVIEGKIFTGRSKGNLSFKENITHAEALTAIRNLLIGAKLINQ